MQGAILRISPAAFGPHREGCHVRYTVTHPGPDLLQGCLPKQIMDSFHDEIQTLAVGCLQDIAGEKNGEPSVELVEEVTFGYQPEDTTMLYPEGVEEGCGFTLLEVRAELDKNCSDQARRFQNIRIIIQTGGTGSVESATSVTVDEQTSQSAGTGVENTIAAHAEVESLAYASVSRSPRRYLHYSSLAISLRLTLRTLQHPFRDFSALDAAATLLAQVTAVTDD